MWYFVDGVLILKDSVWPTFTLIDVANPWIEESPAPLTCQSRGGIARQLVLAHDRIRRAGGQGRLRAQRAEGEGRERQSDRKGEQPQPRRSQVGRR